jgi:hypothetical protein
MLSKQYAIFTLEHPSLLIIFNLIFFGLYYHQPGNRRKTSHKLDSQSADSQKQKQKKLISKLARNPQFDAGFPETPKNASNLRQVNLIRSPQKCFLAAGCLMQYQHLSTFLSSFESSSGRIQALCPREYIWREMKKRH